VGAADASPPPVPGLPRRVPSSGRLAELGAAAAASSFQGLGSQGGLSCSPPRGWPSRLAAAASACSSPPAAIAASPSSPPEAAFQAAPGATVAGGRPPLSADGATVEVEDFSAGCTKLEPAAEAAPRRAAPANVAAAATPAAGSPPDTVFRDQPAEGASAAQSPDRHEDGLAARTPSRAGQRLDVGSVLADMSPARPTNGGGGGSGSGSAPQPPQQPPQRLRCWPRLHRQGAACVLVAVTCRTGRCSHAELPKAWHLHYEHTTSFVLLHLSSLHQEGERGQTPQFCAGTRGCMWCRLGRAARAWTCGACRVPLQMPPSAQVLHSASPETAGAVYMHLLSGKQFSRTLGMRLMQQAQQSGSRGLHTAVLACSAHWKLSAYILHSQTWLSSRAWAGR